MSWQINPGTGDYIMTNGAPVDDTSLIYPAYYRLKIPRTKWMYAPDTNYGSDLYTLQKRFSATDVNPVANIAQVALQPMVDDGRASDAEVTYLSPKSLNDVQLSAVITDAQGQPQVLNLPSIGI